LVWFFYWSLQYKMIWQRAHVYTYSMQVMCINMILCQLHTKKLSAI
jgi:hypothetical protein